MKMCIPLSISWISTNCYYTLTNQIFESRGTGGVAWGRVITLKEAEAKYYWSAKEKSTLPPQRRVRGASKGDRQLQDWALNNFWCGSGGNPGLEYWWEEGTREAGKDL